MLKTMLCNTYMSMIHVRVEFTLFTKARFVDEVGKREELNDEKEFRAIQDVYFSVTDILSTH